VASVLKDGVSTRDIGGTAGTRAVGKAVIAALANENLSS
jgi:isocitrate/isopropylmalate dehydrogenase